jgi:hypothetical protein
MATRQRRLSAGTRLVVAVALGLCLATLTDEAMAKTFHLSISGEGGARYSGVCTVMAPSGDQQIELEGAVPLEREFDGDGVMCRFNTEGQVVAEITHGGSRSRSATNGATIQVSAR